MKRVSHESRTPKARMEALHTSEALNGRARQGGGVPAHTGLHGAAQDGRAEVNHYPLVALDGAKALAELVIQAVTEYKITNTSSSDKDFVWSLYLRADAALSHIKNAQIAREYRAEINKKQHEKIL